MLISNLFFPSRSTVWSWKIVPDTLSVIFCIGVSKVYRWYQRFPNVVRAKNLKLCGVSSQLWVVNYSEHYNYTLQLIAKHRLVLSVNLACCLMYSKTTHTNRKIKHISWRIIPWDPWCSLARIIIYHLFRAFEKGTTTTRRKKIVSCFVRHSLLTRCSAFRIWKSAYDTGN